jgi:hypothetical protein
MCFFPTHGVFADNGTTQSTSVEVVNMLIKMASRWRTVPAILAWKLMSNDFIYASGLWLDKSLFTMWNYMKNFANFTLWFLLVYKIAASLFTKDAFAIKKELPNFLIASILLNMSWFLMGTLIDISNVATAAIGSFPQAMISDQTLQTTGMEALNVSIPDKICVNLDKWQQECSQTFSPTQKIDRIWARFNDMSWPLLYIGASIYRFQDYDLVNKDIKDFKDFTIGTALKLLMLLMYIAPIVALFVINLKRVFYLWLWIIFSPLIILADVLNIKAIKDMWGKDKLFDKNEIIGMIFQPVFVIWGMAIVLILGTSMFAVMWWHPWSSNKTEQVSTVFGWAEIISAPWTSTFHNTTAGTEITFVWDIFKDIAGYAGGLVWYLIITTFVIMLLWAVVKMSTSSSSLAQWTFNSITKIGKDLVTWMNIIPMGWSNVSLWSMMNSINPEGSNNLLTKWLKDYNRENAKDATKKLSSAFYNSKIGKGLQNTYGTDIFSYEANPAKDIGDDEVNAIQKASTSTTVLKDFIWNISTLLEDSKKENNKKHITLKSTKFKDTLFDSINNNKSLKQDVAEWLFWGDISKVTKDALFDGTSTSSKKFLEYIQKKFIWDSVSDLKNFIPWKTLIGHDFTIFGGDAPTTT